MENEKDTAAEKSGQNTKHLIHCLTVIGQIEGHYVLAEQNKTTRYEHIIPALVAVEQDRSVEGLMIILNTVGGDVEAGLAIAELISGMKKPTVSLVLGGGHSIGIPLAVAAKKSFIAKSASMTVHPVRTSGLTIGVSQTFDYFRKMQDRITTFVCENSKISKGRYNKLVLNTGELVMDVGTILEGQEAVDEMVHLFRQLRKRVHYSSFPSTLPCARIARRPRTDSIPQTARNVAHVAQPKASVASGASRCTASIASESIANEAMVLTRPRATLAARLGSPLSATSNRNADGTAPASPETTPRAMATDRFK